MPIKIVKPQYPAAWARRSQAVHIRVEFYIDPVGRVRMPAVSSRSVAADPKMAAAALDAVSQWRFDPPLRKGKPVLVHAEQDFTFSPLGAAASTTSSSGAARAPGAP